MGLQGILSMVTVEPCVLFYLVANYLTSLANQNLILDRICRVNLGQSDDLCDTLKDQNFTDNSTAQIASLEVQRISAEMNSVGKLVSVMISFVAVLLWGLWSDRNQKRKPLIMLPLIGEVIKNVCLVLSVFFHQWNAETIFVIENAFPLVFGSWSMILLGVFSHVMDTTTLENRTAKVAMSSVFVTVGEPLGSALSGVILNKFGYYSVFGTGSSLMFLGLIYCVFRVKELAPKANPDRGCAPRMSICRLILDFFNFKDFKSILKVIYRRRGNNKRIMLLIGYSVIIFGFGPNLGHYSVQYLYSRQAFKFTEIEYSLFGTITSLCAFFAIILIMFLNKRFLRLNDFGLSLVGLSFGIASSIMFGCSKGARDFYIGGALDSCFGAFGIGLRAAMMKLVESHETARSNAIIGALEGALFLLFGSLYSFVYSLTVELYAGAFYFITSLCYSYSFLAVIVLFLIQRKSHLNLMNATSTITIESSVEK